MTKQISNGVKKNMSIIIVVLTLIGVVAFINSDGGDSVGTSREKLVTEFTGAGAYLSDIVPNGNLVEVDMVATESEVEIFEGVKTRVWSYNGTVPGPELRIKLGDTLKVNFTNNLPQETTVHFHGVRVPNAMDGVPGVTQEAIKPGETFVYAFTPKDAGTFWFHPHVRTAEQVERGLFGTLIVEGEIDKEYSQDKVWVVDDWRMTNDYQVDERFVTPGDLMHDGRWGNVITVNGKLNEVLNTRPGERIRLRLINTSNARVYALNFSGLKANAIAIDGMYVKEVFNATRFELAPGNRIDVDITIPRDADGKKYVVYDSFTGNNINLATIKVGGEVVSTTGFDFPTNKKVPDWAGAMGVGIDKEYVLDARRKPGSGMDMMGEIQWTINGKAYPEYDPFALKYGKFNTMRFRNDSSRLHPMHLHGQFFKVVARDGNAVDEGYFRDTVLVKPKETVDIALVPLDKGTWVNHCHILEHADAGMITAVTVE